MPSIDHHDHRERAAVVITGVGLVSPLGDGAWPTLTALLGGYGVNDRAKSLPQDMDPMALVQHVGHVAAAGHGSTDLTVELAERAGREALFMAGAQPATTPCLLAASKGAVGAVIAASSRYGRYDVNDDDPNPLTSSSSLTPDAKAFALGPHGYLAHHLTRRLGCPVRSHVVTASASSLTPLHQGRLMLTHDRTSSAQAGSDPSRLMVVTCESSLLPLFIASYRRLGVLPPLRADRYRALPLDRDRRGFVPSQLGAAVVLERVERVLPGQIELVDTAIAADAYDLVRSSPNMAALSRIAHQLLSGRSIDLLHPHATGTVDHDPAELVVLGRHLTNHADVYACKGALGHGLGASGLVSLVLAWLIAKSHRRPPMPWLRSPIDINDSPVTLTADTRHGSYGTHAIFSAGFGGHTAGAVIERRS